MAKGLKAVRASQASSSSNISLIQQDSGLNLDQQTGDQLTLIVGPIPGADANQGPPDQALELKLLWAVGASHTDASVSLSKRTRKCWSPSLKTAQSSDKFSVLEVWVPGGRTPNLEPPPGARLCVFLQLRAGQGSPVLSKPGSALCRAGPFLPYRTGGGSQSYWD